VDQICEQRDRVRCQSGTGLVFRADSRQLVARPGEAGLREIRREDDASLRQCAGMSPD
jgi:hypothetical protein